ncbi:MAG TPA: shikimate kinase AroK [Cellvibrionaceae bacterium]
MPDSHLFLIGPMGVGKSTIGRLLAAEIALPFYDSDRVIEERTGADIPWIFDMEGEDGFRVREAAVLADLVATTPAIIATGGGIVTRDENCRLMRKTGKIFYLTASIDQLVERTARDKKRPLLQVDNPREKIMELLRERDTLYRSVADHVINTDKCSPKAAATEIAVLGACRA